MNRKERRAAAREAATAGDIYATAKWPKPQRQPRTRTERRLARKVVVVKAHSYN